MGRIALGSSTQAAVRTALRPWMLVVASMLNTCLVRWAKAIERRH